MSDDVSTEELSDEELDVQLREVADKSIDLANPQAQRFHKENVSQGMMYGTARFNAFVVASHADDVLAYDEDRDRAPCHRVLWGTVPRNADQQSR